MNTERRARDPLIPLAIICAVGAGILLLFSLLVGCAAGSTPRQVTAAGVVAALDCEAAHLTGDALGSMKGLAEERVQGWITGKASADRAALEAKVKTDLRLFWDDAGHCAIAGALAAVVAVAAPTPGVATSALVSGPDPAQVRAAFQVAARVAGWPPVTVAGQVL